MIRKTLDKIGIETEAMTSLEIIAITLYTVAALVSTELATLILIDWSLTEVIYEFAMPHFGHAVTIELATLLGVLSIISVAMSQGFDESAWGGLHEYEQGLLVVGILVFVLPPLIPSVGSLVTYHLITQFTAFGLSSVAMYILARSEYNGSSLF